MSEHPLSDLSDQFHSIITRRDDVAFSKLHSTLVTNPSFDEIFGGIFDYNEPDRRRINDACILCATYALAANIFADPEYARTAISGLNFVSQHHHLSDGLYADSVSFADTGIRVDQLREVLDPSQWQALQTYFNIQSADVIHWNELVRHVPLKQIADLSGLHPKQAPLAFDGALQMLQHLINPPESSATSSVQHNISFCHALLLSATYLNQSQHAEIALDLFERIKVQVQTVHIPMWQYLLLQRLAYHWNEHAFADLCSLVNDGIGDQVSSGLLRLCNINPKADSHNADGADSNPYQQTMMPLLNECQYVVLIEGAAFEVRQWLQLTNNHYNPTIWFFARPQNVPCHARLLDTNGQIKLLNSIDELLDFVANLTVTNPFQD